MNERLETMDKALKKITDESEGRDSTAGPLTQKDYDSLSSEEKDKLWAKTLFGGGGG